MKFVKVLAVALAAICCLSAFVGCNKDVNYAENNTEFVIGMSGPLTGGVAVYGVAVRNSAQMAVDEINAAGGLDGVKFKLIAMDDEHKADKVPGLYAEMYESGMQVSLGTVTTAPALEFKTLSYEDNVFFMTPSASGDDVPENANGYQMCFADGNQGNVSGEFVKTAFAGQTIGVFYKTDDPYSKGIYDQFKATVGDTVTLKVTSFDDSTATSFDTQIDKLKDCKFIFMPTYSDAASLFMMQAVERGMPTDVVYYGCDGFDGIENTEGFDITKVPQKVTMLSHFNSKAESGKAKEYSDKYIAKYGVETLNQFGASAYDCVYAIFGAMKAAKAAGKEIEVTMSASDLCEILKEQFQGGYTFTGGATGAEGSTISWDENGYVNKAAVQYVIKDFSTAA